MLAAIALTSCEDVSTEGFTRITYYPNITILGNVPGVVYLGETYVDEGCTVEMSGEDFTDQVVVDSNVNTSQIGFYGVTYSASNEDGFSRSATRMVVVANGGHFDTAYYGESQYSTMHYYNAPILITKNADGTYLLDDIMGGLYFNGRYPGYENSGYDFHAEATLKLEADNSITVQKVGSWYFEGTALSVETAVYDPATGNISMELVFGGSPFYVNFTPITK